MKHEKKKQSSRSIQTSLFFGSLKKEMNKLAEKKSQLAQYADDYASQGCSGKEIEELLMIDGFDGDLIRSYISTSASADQSENENKHNPMWGFEIQDACGDIVTHADLNMEIRAATKDDAIIKIQGMMNEEKDAGLEKIVNVYEI